MDIDWKRLIGGIAPTIGTALGGPLAGTAISAIAAAFGLGPSASEADVAAAVKSAAANGSLTGEQVVLLKQADLAFQQRMRELDIDVLKINQAADDAVLRDVQDARARQVATRDYMPQIIFFLLLAAYIGEFCLFIFGEMPEDEFTRALITRAFGTVESGLIGAIAYFIGSSRGSKNSGDAVRKIAEIQAASK